MAIDLKRIQILAKPSSNWTAADPVLLNGQLGAADVGSSAPLLKIGDGVRPWSQLPNLIGAGGGGGANDYVAGPVTTLPPGSPATVVIDNTVDPPTISFGIPEGDPGAPGDPGTPGAPGTPGGPGPAGPPNALAIGTVTTGAPGSAAGATITGTPPNQTLSLTIPQGAQGNPGTAGAPGPPGNAMLADPSSTIALVAKNGTSIYAMRADAAPALDQGIAPTWTGPHTFVQPVRGTAISSAAIGTLDARSATPGISLYNTGAGANAKMWLDYISGSELIHSVWNDAENITREYGRVARAGVAIASLSFGNATDNPVYTFLGNNNTVLGGNLVVRAGGVYLQASARLAIQDDNDGYLRLNKNSEYANGIYAMGVIHCTGRLKSDIGLSNGPASLSLQWGPQPSRTYGTCYLSGGSGGFLGIGIHDGPLDPTFMSNGSAGGIFLQGEGKWLIYRSAANTATTDYNLTTGGGVTAAAFNVSSSRTLKRETGKPTRAADILSRLRPILYRLLADPKDEQIGLIAEEAHAICPWLSRDGKTVSYDRLALLLLADWQESRGLTAAS